MMPLTVALLRESLIGTNCRFSCTSSSFTVCGRGVALQAASHNRHASISLRFLLDRSRREGHQGF